MKKVIFTIIAFWGVQVTLNAQIVLTAADYSKVGAAIVQNTDTLPTGSITPGSSGANVMWNFGALHNHTTLTDNFIAPSSGLLGTSFPMSNACINQGNGNYLYLDTTNAAATLVGYAGDLLQNSANEALVLGNPQTLVTFPSTYNTAFTDTASYDVIFPYNNYYQGIYIDSLREKQSTVITSLMDGWGTVVTPNGSFACLRQNILKQTIDSTWAKITVGSYQYWMNVTGSASSTQSYSYLSNVIGGGPLVDIEFYPDSNTIALVNWNPVANAGITLTAADYSKVDPVITQNTDTLPVNSLTPGNAGANNIYDFTALHAHTALIDSFIAPAAGLLGTSFPTSNVCLSEGSVNYIYLDTTSASVTTVGYAGDLLMNGVNQALVLNNPETIITFPSMYNTGFTDAASFDKTSYYGATYEGIYVDSLREKQIINVNSLMDGWGTVISPIGSYSCLRQNITRQTVDSIWAEVTVGNVPYWMNISGTTSSVQSYSYLSNVIGGGPVVDIQYYPDSNAILEIKWRGNAPLAVNNLTANSATNVYPNPASEYIVISNPSSENANIILYDLAGREVMNVASSEQKRILPVNNLNNGTYILKIFNKTGLVQSDKIIVIH